MKKIIAHSVSVLVALSLGAGVASAQFWDESVYDDNDLYDSDYNEYEYDYSTDPYWGEYAYDEQQWWNPFDWFDDTTTTWDYSNEWYDYNWYEDDSDVGVGGYNGSELGTDFEMFEDEEGLYDDSWNDYDWYDDYDYDTGI